MRSDRPVEASAEAPLRVLIVEDEVLIALELQDLLSEAGHVSVGIAATSTEAVRLGRALRPDVALVDITLADGPTGVEVARTLGAVEETTVVFTTGNRRRIPADFAGAAGAIGKPYSERCVRGALAYFGGRHGRRRATRPPEGVILAPRLLAKA